MSGRSSMKESMLRVDHVVRRTDVVYSFDPRTAPVLEIDTGAVVLFETQDCFGGQLESENDLVTAIDFAYANPATGPVAVRGAVPGDSLVVEILSVQPGNRGFTTIAPGVGQLAGQCNAPVTKVFAIENGTIQFTDSLHLPLRPMLGVMGVAPAADPVATLHPGEHGGNVDDKYHAAGTTVYFPVRRPGALFAVGDMHASMGDGEICGTGVEVAGEVTLRFTLLKGKMTRFPVSETEHYWITHGVGERYPEALEAACQEAASLLTNEWHLTIEEAFMLLSVCADAGVCQSCQPCTVASTARMMVPKMGAITRPFA